MFSELMLLVMQAHMLWFIDGGIINGTPNHVSLSDRLWFMSYADTSFIVSGLSIIIAYLLFNTSNVSKKAILYYKRYRN